MEQTLHCQHGMLGSDRAMASATLFPAVAGVGGGRAGT